MERFLLLALLAAAPAYAEETPFEPGERFASAGACVSHLSGLIAAAGAENYEAVRGPYPIADGDVRIHMVRAEGSGHRIWEHRCLGAELSARTWHHSMEAAEEFTVESVARDAEWLKKPAPEQ